MKDKDNGGMWGCLIAFLVIFLALAYIVYGRGCRSLKGTETPGAPVSPPGSPAVTSPPAPPDQLMFKTSETYYDQVAAVGKTWSKTHGAALQLHLLEKEGSREAMQHIRQPTGKEPIADMWLSSTMELVSALADADGTKHVNLADSSRKVLFPPQPLVFLVRGRQTNPVDAYLRKENPLLALPKNQYHYSCADILKSGGGDSAARYLKWTFQQRSDKSQSFQQFLEDLKARGFVARLKDSGPLTTDFEADTQLTFILVHQALADREIAHGGKVHKIIPQWTIFEQPAAVLLQTGLDRHGDKAKEFLQFLKANLDLSLVTGANAIGETGDVNGEKRVWETVFNESRRLEKSGR